MRAGDTQGLLSALPDGVVVYDPETGTIHQVNDAFCELVGTSSPELCGRSFEELWQWPHSVCDPKVADSSECERYDWELVTEVGDHLPVEVRLTTATLEGRQCGVATIREQTDERRRPYRTLLFEALEEAIDCGILITDADLSVRWHNSRFAALWELPEDNPPRGCDQPIVDYVLDRVGDPEPFEATIEALYEPPFEPRHTEIERKDGRWFDRRATPILGEDGTHHGTVVLTRDITEHKAANNGITQLDSVTLELAQASTTDEIATIVVDGMCELVDLPMTTCWLYDETDHVLRPVAWADDVTALLGEVPTLHPGESVAWDAFESGEIKEFDDISAHPDRLNDETELRSEIILPLGDHGVLITASTSPNVFTEYDRTLARIFRANAVAALDWVSRKEQLLTQRKAIENRESELEMLKQVFSRVFRHNVRNELTVISGSLKLLERHQTNETLQRSVAAALKSTERLLAHTQKAREIEKLVDAESQRTTRSLEAVVSNAVSEYHDAGPGVTIEVDVEDVSVTVVDGFTRAVENALENAIEHNTHPVRIEIKAEARDEDVVVVIADDGDGIPLTETEMLTEETETSLTHGSGVGLWVIKWYAEAAGGTVEFARTADGTEVRLQLPRSPTDDTSRSQP